ncbi:MAG: alkaline phosphatase [Chthoniobacteraceae bacterium]
MRLRNNLLALAILLGFLGLGVLYVRFWVVQRPYGIIVFVSDGLITRHITAARLYENGAGHRLEMERLLPHSALLRNDPLQFAVADGASAASALATGKQARHHTVGVDGRGTAIASILELARKEGRAVGLVTNGSLTGASPAAFYAHTANAEDGQALAAQLLAAPQFKVLLGGGSEDFLPAGKGGHRKDGKDLLAGLKAPGWDVIRTRAELEGASPYREGTLFGLFAEGAMDFSKKRELIVAQPSLSDLVRRAIECLETNRHGYVLIVDEALISQACVLNDGEHLMRETLELDRAIGKAVEYAGEKSLILAVGRTSIGGFTLSGYPMRQDKGLALLGPTPEGNPYITWATGPKGGKPNEPVARDAAGGVNAAEDLLALGVGLGAERLHGFLDNTDIFQILRDAL